MKLLVNHFYESQNGIRFLVDGVTDTNLYRAVTSGDVGPGNTLCMEFYEDGTPADTLLTKEQLIKHCEPTSEEYASKVQYLRKDIKYYQDRFKAALDRADRCMKEQEEFKNKYRAICATIQKDFGSADT
jgi:hypothetical protein